MDREICAQGAVGSLRRFEGDEEEWRGGEGEREIVMASRRRCEKARRVGRGGESGKNPCALLRCTYWSLTDEASPHDWRRMVGRRATSEAPLPCRLGPLLDDHPETRLMGPVGAPEIPTRTRHNARLKVGSTTDGKAPTDATTFKQGRTVTSPDLLPALPFSLLFPCPSIVSLLRASSYLSLVHSSSSSADSTAILTTLSSLVHLPLLAPVLIACARAVPTNDRIVHWPSGALRFWIALHATTFRESEKIDTLEDQNNDNKFGFSYLTQWKEIYLIL